MKKVYALTLLSIPLCLVLGFGAGESIEEEGEQGLQAQQRSYFRETDSISMIEVGQLLERMGREIQQSGSISIGGDSFLFTGIGGLEISVRNQRLQIEMGGGRTGPPARGSTYVAYFRNFGGWTLTEVAELLAKFGETLGSTGNFVMEDYIVALEGSATVEQRLIENPGPRGRRYTYTLNVVFGPQEFPLPEDERDEYEPEQQGTIRELAKREITSADQTAIARLLDSLSRDLKARRVRVRDQELETGENVGVSLSHLVATDGQSNRIQVRIQVREEAPPPRE